MAEVKEGQQIIFKHPESGEILCGFVGVLTVMYLWGVNNGAMPKSHIKEWCDASEAWNSLNSQKSRTGSFEWNEGPTVEPIK